MKEEPGIETWLNQDCGEQDIDRELRNLAKRKAHGNGGIPGEEYKETMGNNANNEDNEPPKKWETHTRKMDRRGNSIHVQKQRRRRGDVETKDRYS